MGTGVSSYSENQILFEAESCLNQDHKKTKVALRIDPPYQICAWILEGA